MEEPYGNDLPCRLMRIAVLLGVIAALVGAGHLAAWLGGYMTQRGLTAITMKTNAAFCLTLAGLALMLLGTPYVKRGWRWAAKVCAALPFLVGLLTLVENLSGWDFGIDQLVAVEAPGALAVTGANRMGVPASLGFALAGLALLIFSRRDHRGVWAAQVLALVVCVIGLLATIGFLYGSEQLYGIARYTGIAWPTALTLLLLGLGLLCARPAEGLMAQVTANDPGGLSIRRLLPAFVILPVLLGYLRLAGEWAGVFDAPMGTGITMITFIVLFSALTYHTGRRASRSAQSLSRNQVRLVEAQRLAKVGDWEWDLESGAVFWSRQMYDIFGRRPELSPPAYQEHPAYYTPESWARLQDAVTRTRDTGEPYALELEHIREDGVHRWHMAKGEAARDNAGRIVKLHGTAQDITEHKQADEAMRIKDSAMASSVSAMAIGDLQGRLTYVNSAFLRLWGYDHEREVLGKSALDFWEVPEQALEAIRTIRAGEGWAGEMAAVRRDGSRRNLHLSAGMVLNPTGEPVCMMASFVDITERKQAEMALRASEERFRRSFELGLIGLAITSPTKGMIEVNDEFCRILGYERDELLRKTWPELTHPEDLNLDVAQYDRVLAGQIEGYTIDKRYIRKDGQAVDTTISVTAMRNADGAPECFIALIQDITERKRAEEAVRTGEAVAREQAAQLEAILDAAPAIIWIAHDRDCERITGNLAAREFSRVSDSRVNLSKTGPAPERLAHYRIFANGVELQPQDMPIQVAARSGRRLQDCTLEFRFDDGAARSLTGNVVPLIDARGEPNGAIAAFLDVTEHERSQAALRDLTATLESKVVQRTAEVERARQRLYAVLEAIPAMVCLLTPDYHVAFANRSFRKIFGESNGRHCYEFCYGRTEPCEFCETYHVLKTGRPHRWEVTSPDGRTIMDAYDFPFTDVDGSPLILEMDIDITARKQAETALRELNEKLSHRARQLQKLTLELTQAEERERRRVAVILHEDLQQQIAGARFHLNLLKGRGGDDRQRMEAERIDAMLKGAIEKSRNLSRDLSPTVVEMNDLGEALGWLIHRTRMQHGVTARLDMDGEMVLPSEAAAIFLFRAAQELLFNVAKHAGVNEAVIRARRFGRYVGLSVSDQGCGFDPQELKEAAGLGLLSLRERTELLGGRLRIQSAKGRGSRFRIVIPDGSFSKEEEHTARGPASVGAVPSVVRPFSAGHVLRVLVVDDHEMVRQGLASLLAESPQVVVVGQAANGSDAINMAMELRPSVVIMDVSMPLMPGHEAARQIKAHLPETRIIAMSMYDEADKIAMMYQAGAENYVLKTASADELLAAVFGKESGSRETSG